MTSTAVIIHVSVLPVTHNFVDLFFPENLDPPLPKRISNPIPPKLLTNPPNQVLSVKSPQNQVASP